MVSKDDMKSIAIIHVILHFLWTIAEGDGCGRSTLSNINFLSTIFFPLFLVLLFFSPFQINDSLLNISGDIIIDNEEEEDVNPEIRLRIKWEQEILRLPIRKVSIYCLYSLFH